VGHNADKQPAGQKEKERQQTSLWHIYAESEIENFATDICSHTYSALNIYIYLYLYILCICRIHTTNGTEWKKGATFTLHSLAAKLALSSYIYVYVSTRTYI